MQLLRNCNVTTVAPTGTISIIAGCSSGLEPLFAVAFMRNQAGVMMPDVNEDFVAIAKREGWYSRRADGAHREGRAQSTSPKCRRSGSACSSRRTHIAPEWHIRMQAAFQEHCDSAISKTTNFAHTATRRRRARDLRARVRAEVQGRHGLPRRLARQPGALAPARRRRPRRERDERGTASGIAASSASCTGTLAERDAEIERLKKALYEAEAENLQRRAKRSRPDKLRGTTIRKETPLGTMFVNITEDDKGQPFEVFITLGKAGGAAMADAEAMGRLISLALRSGIPLMRGPPAAARHLRRIARSASDRTRCCRCRTRSASRSRSGGARSRGCSRSCSRPPTPAAQAPRATPEAIQAASDVAAAQAQMQMGFEVYNNSDGVHGDVPGLRIAARVRRRVREVSRVRILGMRVR